MVNWLIEASLRNRFLVLGLFVLVGAWGYWALLTTPIDAIPDLSDNQVIVFTDWTGRSPQEVEDQITYPLTVSLQGLPGVRVVRSASALDRKSTRLNSSHLVISYAVFCLKKKNKHSRAYATTS